MKNIIKIVVILLFISSISYGQENIAEYDSSKILKNNPAISSYLKKNYAKYIPYKIIETDLDGDGVKEYVIALGINKEDYITFIKMIVIENENEKIVNYGEVIVGNESAAEREDKIYDIFLNVDDIKIIKVDKSDENYIYCQTSVRLDKEGRTIYGLRNKKIVKIEEAYPAGVMGEFIMEGKNGIYYPVDILDEFYQCYEVKKIDRWDSRNYKFVTDKIEVKRRDDSDGNDIEKKLRLMIEAAILKEYKDIERLEKDIKLRNISEFKKFGKDDIICHIYLNKLIGKDEYRLEIGGLEYRIIKIGEKEYKLLEIIRYIEGWKHQTKSILINNGFKIEKVELDGNYPIFYVKYNENSIAEKTVFEKISQEIFKANGYWDFKIVDEVNKFAASITGDKKSKKIVKIEY